MLAIEIAVEIEEMRLEPEIGAADRRPPAEIGGSVKPARRSAFLDPGAHGVDARGGAQIIGERDIGGRKADGTAEPVAGLDPALNLPRPAQQRSRLARLAGDEQLADLGRGISHAARPCDRRHDADAETLLLALGFEQLGRAAAAIAEDEIIADHDLANT